MKKWTQTICALTLALTMAVSVALIPASASTKKSAVDNTTIQNDLSYYAGGVVRRFWTALLNLDIDGLTSLISDVTGDSSEVLNGVLNENYSSLAAQATVKKAGSKVKKAIKKGSSAGTLAGTGLQHLVYFRMNTSGEAYTEKNDVRFLPNAIWYTNDGCMCVLMTAYNGYSKNILIDKITYVYLKTASGTVIAEGYPQKLSEKMELYKFTNGLAGKNSAQCILKFKKGTFNPNIGDMVGTLKYNVKFSGNFGTTAYLEDINSMDLTASSNDLINEFMTGDDGLDTLKSPSAVKKYANELAEFGTAFLKLALAHYGYYITNTTDYTEQVAKRLTQGDMTTMASDIISFTSDWLLENINEYSEYYNSDGGAIDRTMEGASMAITESSEIYLAAQEDVLHFIRFFTMLRWLPFIIP